MVDWQGLLKWSLANSDGTSNKDIKPMDEERRKWLEEALTHYCLDEVSRMQQILLTLSQDEIPNSENECSTRTALLEELLDLTEGLGKSRDMIIVLDGGRVLLQILLRSTYVDVKQRCSEVLCSTVQNNAELQHYLITIGAMDIMDAINKDNNMKNKEALLTVLSSVIRGEYLDGKRRFIELKGIEFILSVISNRKENSVRLIQKASFFLKDLVYYDDRLHLSFTNTDVFSNTNAVGKHSQLLEGLKDKKGLMVADPTAKFENELPENKKFKDIVKTSLYDLEIFPLLREEILQEGNINVERRNCALRILHQLLEFNKGKVKDFDKKFIEEHLKKTQKENIANEGLNDTEIEFCSKILSL